MYEYLYDGNMISYLLDITLCTPQAKKNGLERSVGSTGRIASYVLNKPRRLDWRGVQGVLVALLAIYSSSQEDWTEEECREYWSHILLKPRRLNWRGVQGVLVVCTPQAKKTGLKWSVGSTGCMYSSSQEEWTGEECREYWQNVERQQIHWRSLSIQAWQHWSRRASTKYSPFSLPQASRYELFL